MVYPDTNRNLRQLVAEKTHRYSFEDIKMIFRDIWRPISVKDPYAIMLFGKREERAFMYPKEVLQEVLKQDLNYWFGRSDYSEDKLKKLRSNLVTWLSNADFISMSENIVTKTIFNFTKAKDIRTVGGNVHIGLCTENVLEKIIRKFKNVTLITCRAKVIGKMERRWPDINFKLIQIPEWGKHIEEPNHHWFERHDDVIEKLGDLKDYNLVLIGAGILGKSYCYHAKNGGHFAIDMDSVFDVWSGVTSLDQFPEL